MKEELIKFIDEDIKRLEEKLAIYKKKFSNNKKIVTLEDARDFGYSLSIMAELTHKKHQRELLVNKK